MKRSFCLQSSSNNFIKSALLFHSWGEWVILLIHLGSRLGNLYWYCNIHGHWDKMWSISNSLQLDKKITSTWKLCGWFRSHSFHLTSIMKFKTSKYPIELQGKVMLLLIVITFLNVSATKTTLNFFNYLPCVEEAEASSDCLSLSNICK